MSHFEDFWKVIKAFHVIQKYYYYNKFSFVSGILLPVDKPKSFRIFDFHKRFLHLSYLKELTFKEFTKSFPNFADVVKFRKFYCLSEQITVTLKAFKCCFCENYFLIF